MLKNKYFKILYFVICLFFVLAPLASSEIFDEKISLGAENIFNFGRDNRLPVADAAPAPPQKKQDAAPLELSSKSVIAIDAVSGETLFEKNADASWQIASITKLAAALTFFDEPHDLESIYQVKESDRREGGKIYIFSGEKVRTRDLLYTSLVGSGNTETAALFHSLGFEESAFVEKMNVLAQNKFGLKKTFFYDATGLRANVSTAREITKIVSAALANEDIKKATVTNEYNFKTIGGREKRIQNTDLLLDIFPQNGVELIGGKTGYNGASEYCFTSEFQDKNGREILVAVLGAPTPQARFDDAKKLAHWVFENYSWE